MTFVDVHAGYGGGGKTLASFELHKVGRRSAICWGWCLLVLLAFVGTVTLVV